MKTILLALVFSIVMVLSAFADRGVPASEGIGNFGKVDELLFRGAQPDADGIKHLQALGVKMIINLRQPKGVLKEEQIQARASGMTYTNISLAGVGKPTDDEVKSILALIANAPGPVFIHCEHGCDRTRTIVACYRIQHDHWSAERPIREAEKYGDRTHLRLGPSDHRGPNVFFRRVKMPAHRRRRLESPTNHLGQPSRQCAFGAGA